MKSTPTSPALDHLLSVMERLRDPNTGCPWDVLQNFKSIAPYTLEETYELVEAIEAEDVSATKDELGDVLFQVVFHSQIAKDLGLFDLNDVALGVADKMIERHPHVFGKRNASTAQDVKTNWEADKEAKRTERALAEGRAPSALDGVSTALPAVTRAIKLQNRAARQKFDWAEARDVCAKIREEIGELEAEIDVKANKHALEDEMGDVLFAVVNLARKLNIDPETALRSTNRKFERRFREIEVQLASQNKTLADATLEEMEAIWVAIKQREKRERVEE